MGPRAFLRFAEAGGFRGRRPFCEFGPRAVCRCAAAGGFYLDLFQLAGI